MTIADDLETAQAARRRERWLTVVPPRFADVTLDWVAEHHPVAAKKLERWDGRQNLVILGPVGTGKTGTAFAVSRNVIEQGVPFRYAKAVTAFDSMRPGGEPGALQALLDTHLLLLDDLGVEKPSEWTTERLTAIIDHRWERERPTIITSNLTGKQLRSWVGERAYSRVTGDGMSVQLSGDDQRRQRR